MKFSREFLLDIQYNDKELSIERVQDKRWTRVLAMVFEHEGKFYQVLYEAGLTENCEVEPWENEEEVEGVEVVQVEKTIKVWEPK